MTKFILIAARVSYWFACSCAATLALALVIGGSTLVGCSSRLDLSVVGVQNLGPYIRNQGCSGLGIFRGDRGLSKSVRFRIFLRLDRVPQRKISQLYVVFLLLAGGCCCLLRLFSKRRWLLLASKILGHVLSSTCLCAPPVFDLSDLLSHSSNRRS